MTITTRFHAALWATVAWATLGAAALDEASADVVSLQQNGGGYTHQDTFVRNDGAVNSNGNNNSQSRILTGALGNGSVIRAIFSFPLTGIPSGATINSVTFGIHLGEEDGASINTVRTMELQSISESFTQTTATWNNTFGASMALGGTVLSSTTMAPRFTLPMGGYPKPSYTFATSTSLVSAVQSSLNLSQPFNFAIVAQSAVEAGSERAIFRIVSNNSTMAADIPYRPMLTINYTAVPEASSFALFSVIASAVGAVVVRKRRASAAAA